MRLDILDNPVELIQRFRGLGVQIDIPREIESLHFIEVLDDNRSTLGLAHKTQHFRMTAFAEDDDLFGTFIIQCFDAFLQLQHHRTGGIDDLDMVLSCEFIGLRRFPMRPEQHFHVM